MNKKRNMIQTTILNFDLIITWQFSVFKILNKQWKKYIAEVDTIKMIFI